MKQQLKTNRLIVFLLGILFLSQTVGAAIPQNDFAAPLSVRAMTPTPGVDFATAVVRQSDGKLIVAGQSQDAGIKKFALVRYNTNGSLDVKFGTGGKVLTAIGSIESRPTAVAVLPDGKILAAGYAKNSGTGWDFALVKYDAFGRLDTTFGNGGILTLDFSTQPQQPRDDFCSAMAIQSDGKIVLGGETDSQSDGKSLIVRENANGTLDSSFGSGGKLINPFRGVSHSKVRSVAMYGSKIVAAGDVGDTSYGYGHAVLARFNSSGSADTSFGSTGMRIIDNSNNDSWINSIGFTAVYAGEDKIVMTGTLRLGIYYHLTVWSVNSADGTPDTTFGSGGKVVTDPLDGVGSGIKVQLRNNVSDKIVVEGCSIYSGCMVFRFMLYGAYDTTFNGSGIATFNGTATALEIQPADNKIVVVGVLNEDFQTARYNSNGTLDTTFDGDGIRPDNIGIN